MLTRRIVLAVLCIYLLVAESPVYAQSPTPSQDTPKKGIEVTPAFQEIVITQKEREKSFTVQLTNHEKDDITLELFPVNFNPAKKEGLGQLSVDQSGSYTYSLSSYVLLPFREINLDAGESKEVQILIQNRQDMPSGGSYIALIARQKKQETSDTTLILPSISSMIFIHKTGGEIYNLRLKDISFPNSLIHFQYPKTVSLSFQNEGNIHLVPRGRIEIRDILGRLVKKGVINAASAYVFPSSQRDIPIELNSISANPPVSLNTITVVGTDSLKKTTFIQSDTFLYVHPIVALLVGTIGGLSIYALILWKRRNIS